jgi:hypothetical protein
VELLTFFVLQPAIAVVIAYKAWRGRPENLRFTVPCVVSGAAAVLLIVFAKWLNADVRTSIYLLQVACFALGFLLFGAAWDTASQFFSMRGVGTRGPACLSCASDVSEKQPRILPPCRARRQDDSAECEAAAQA